ncbi:MAG: Uncharacterised protein [Cellulomonadaceae bacterium TMED98]|nr:MAG: Uncharacterised protein [Cellulomonadaceae bacterium TMED98]
MDGDHSLRSAGVGHLQQHFFGDRFDGDAGSGGEALDIGVFGHGVFGHEHFAGAVWAGGECFSDRLGAFDEKETGLATPRFFGEFGHSADAR